MRPLRLCMTAFGPYAGTEVVNFDALTELGLFVVAGNNGSGKTTIFDALHYALYGVLPGRRASYVRLKSDHVTDKSNCSVTLDFVAHGNHWRVERSPKQTRAKRRGAGTTEAPATATLFRLDQDTPTAITNRVEEVRAKCVELVGLSGKQFERVALLPQGQFSRVLTESSAERRELLRTLFSSEIFDDATTWLTDAAAKATDADRAVLERLAHRQTALGDELSILTKIQVGSTTLTLRDAIAHHRQVELAIQAAAAAGLKTLAQQATRNYQTGLDVAQRLERRRQVQIDLDRHQQAAPQHLNDVERLNNARSAAPVIRDEQSLAQHRKHRDQALQRVSDLRQQLNHALNAAGLSDMDDLDQATLKAVAERISVLDVALSERQESVLQLPAASAIVASSHADLHHLTNEIKNLSEQKEVASTQLRQAEAELETLEQAADIDECESQLRIAKARLTQRIELAELETGYGKLMRRATELDTAIEQLDQARSAAVQAQSSHASVQQKADTAHSEYQESERRRQATDHYQVATHSLQAARVELTQKQAQTDQLWDAFIAGTAARIAKALANDEPCPVCGSCEHPAPAVPNNGGPIVTEAYVATARTQSEAVHARVRALESHIETLRSTDEDIASLSAATLAIQVTTTKAAALDARTLANETSQAGTLYERVDRELSTTRTERTALDHEIRAVDQRRSRIEGALGIVATEPVAVLRAQAADAATARAQADRLAERRNQLMAGIKTSEHMIGTIGLDQIAADNRRTSTQDRLANQQRDLHIAVARRDHADQALAAASSTPIVADQDLDLRARAAQHARSLTSDIVTALAREHDAINALRRGQSFLEDCLRQSPFSSLEQAMAAYVEPHGIAQLEAQTAAHTASGERLQGQLLELADTPNEPPDIRALHQLDHDANQTFSVANTALIAVTTSLGRIESELAMIETEQTERQTTDLDTRRLERVAAMVKGDNDRNTSFENWVLAAHLRDVVELANIRLARSTHQRFQLCVMDDGENKRGKWGLDLGVEDTVTGTQRPTAGLSGGELFQASLALALGLADAVMNQSAAVRVDALFIDEGFGSLDETSVERAIDLLDELRDRGAMVGVITHVPALLDALPLGIRVVEATNGQGSTIKQTEPAQRTLSK
jgi:exonuclease SbcC